MLEPHLVNADDVVRSPVPGPPPVRGAQWDEIHECWERWDEIDGRWHVVAVHHGDHDEPLDDDWIRPPALLGSAPAPVPVIDLRDRKIDTETSLREFLVEARH
jgi:hypothetical protein